MRLSPWPRARRWQLSAVRDSVGRRLILERRVLCVCVCVTVCAAARGRLLRVRGGGRQPP